MGFLWDFYGIYTGFIEFRWYIYERTKWIEWHFYRIPLRDFIKIYTGFRGPTDGMHLKTIVETFQTNLSEMGGKLRVVGPRILEKLINPIRSRWI